MSGIGGNRSGGSTAQLDQRSSVPRPARRPSPPGAAEAGPCPPLPRPVRWAVACAVCVCLATALVHVCLVFLFVAPPNTVSQRYQRQIDAWIYPYFEQNWQLFAPDPQSDQEQISARSAVTSADGARRVGAWVDLTGMDQAAVRHDPFPSRTAQNMLRRAWAAYLAAPDSDPNDPGDPEDSSDAGDSGQAGMLRRYLADIAAQRLGAHGQRAFDAVQLRVTTTPIAPGGRAAAPASDTTYLPWWQVTPHGR
jgi:Family of unknown function (DUF5819)